MSLAVEEKRLLRAEDLHSDDIPESSWNRSKAKASPRG